MRYIGLTHYMDSVHDTMAQIIKTKAVDFIQINYNLIDTHTERRLLPMAIDQNVTVIVNRPFEEGALFNRVKGKLLPPEAKEYDCGSWANFLLSHPCCSVCCSRNIQTLSYD